MFIIGSNEILNIPLGKKAENLHLLKLAGFDVPNGFVISYEDQNKDFNSFIEGIGGYPVAVRSSGELEDLGDSSFAGQYETFLNIDNPEDLVKAIRECFKSAQSERISKYLIEKNIIISKEELSEKMSVLVQKMVDVQFAGVAFSINPLSGKEEEILTELCNGLGEKLVSGLINPSQYIINSKTGEYFYKEQDELVILSDEMLQSLKNNVLEIQAYFKTPQDIEFAFDNSNKLIILQSRPITFINWRNEDEFTNADFKDGGVSSKVCTPMMFSLYRNVFCDSMPAYLRKTKILTTEVETPWIVHHYGIVYWNAGILKRCLIKIPGFDERKFDEDLGIKKEYGDRGPIRTKLGLRSLLSAIPVLIGLAKEYEECIQLIEEAKINYDSIDLNFRNNLTTFKDIPLTDYKKEFLKIYNHFHNYECAYFRTIYNNSNCQTEFKDLASGLKETLGYEIDVLKLFVGLGNISHIEIQKDIYNLIKMAEDKGVDDKWDMRFDDFISKHYHHSDSELDITVPRWIEDPETQKKRILQLLHSKRAVLNPIDSENKQRILFEEYLNQIKIDLQNNSFLGSYHFKKLDKKLKQVRYFLFNREKMREFSTRGYYLIRIALLELAQKMKKENLIENISDIFYFDIDHLLDWCEGKVKLSSDIKYQKLLYLGYSDFTPPNEFGMGVKEIQSYLSSEGVYQGIGCSPGIYEGIARVVLSLDDTNRLRSGDILITKFTDPGWTPTLSIVSAVITEVGGVLSHAAVIGREYGIPAVLNISNITNLIKDGQKIRVDGSSGIITLLE